MHLKNKRRQNYERLLIFQNLSTYVMLKFLYRYINQRLFELKHYKNKSIYTKQVKAQPPAYGPGRARLESV